MGEYPQLELQVAKPKRFKSCNKSSQATLNFAPFQSTPALANDDVADDRSDASDVTVHELAVEDEAK